MRGSWERCTPRSGVPCIALEKKPRQVSGFSEPFELHLAAVVAALFAPASHRQRVLVGDIRVPPNFAPADQQPRQIGGALRPAEIWARAAIGYHAARTRRVSAAGLAPTSGQVVTQIQSGSPRPDSAVRILYAQPRSRLKLEVRRQKVKSARNRADCGPCPSGIARPDREVRCDRPSTTRGPRSEARRRFARAAYAAFLGATLW